jgi:hypothetical protein
VRIARAAVANFFAANAIFLPGKGKGGKGGGAEVGDGAVHVVNGAGANPHGEIATAEEAVGGIVGTAHVFTWAQQEEDANGKGGSFSAGDWAVGLMRQGNDLAEERHRQRLDT